MELKFDIPSILLAASMSSNRTFMELKFACPETTTLNEVVLIAPLWN